MTPFGKKMRELRAEKSMTQAQMAAALHLSPSYLSQLEHGKKGKPSWAMVQDLIEMFDLIWDEAEEIQDLARLSHPRVTIDTSELSAKATELANRLARNIARIDEEKIEKILRSLRSGS
jgi:transcriptional regulator with XRE-family HTH domain